MSSKKARLLEFDQLNKMVSTEVAYMMLMSTDEQLVALRMELAELELLIKEGRDNNQFVRWCQNNNKQFADLIDFEMRRRKGEF